MPAKQPRKILLVRLSSLGDVIQTLPLPAVIHRAFPEASIGWAIDRELAPAIEGLPLLDRIHRCDRNLWGRELRNPVRWPRIARQMKSFIDEIRAVGYDLALDAQGLFKSAVIPFFARIPRRVGFAHGRELTQFFYTEKYISREEYFDKQTLHIDHMLLLAEQIGCDISNYEIRLPEIDAELRAKIDQMLTRAFNGRGPLVALTPGTQWPSKRWPAEYWAELTRKILAETAANIVLVGSDSDMPLASKLLEPLGDAERKRILNVAGQTSMRELYALFARVSVAVASDTAPLHIAAAARCRLVGLFGSTSHNRTGPIGSPAAHILEANPKLPCQPCQDRVCRFGTTECMRLISVDEAFAALTKSLAAA